MLTVCRAIFLWFVYVDHVLHGFLYKAIHLSGESAEAVDEKDDLEKVFHLLGDKGKKIDESYSNVFKRLEGEEEALRLKRDDQDPDIFRKRVQQLRDSKRDMNVYFQREYIKLGMERNHLIRKRMDDSFLCGDDDDEGAGDFEKVYLERKSNEQKHQTRMDNLSALCGETSARSSRKEASLLPPEPS